MSDTKKPAPPKRPQCSFFLYKQEVYMDVKNKNPGKRMTEITKLLSEQYKILPKEEIERYEQLYKVNKVQFEQQKQEYEAQFGKIKNEKKNKRNKQEKNEKSNKKPDGLKKQPVAQKLVDEQEEEGTEDEE